MAETNTKSIERQNRKMAAEATAKPLVPPVDICENQDGVTLYADLPGVGKGGLDVHVDKETLQITGKRTVFAEAPAEGSYTEMPVRDYYRAFTIGEEIDRDKISAQLNNGVLKVVLPKAERAKPKKIEIR